MIIRIVFGLMGSLITSLTDGDLNLQVDERTLVRTPRPDLDLIQGFVMCIVDAPFPCSNHPPLTQNIVHIYMSPRGMMGKLITGLNVAVHYLVSSPFSPPVFLFSPYPHYPHSSLQAT